MAAGMLPAGSRTACRRGRGLPSRRCPKPPRPPPPVPGRAVVDRAPGADVAAPAVAGRGRCRCTAARCSSGTRRGPDRSTGRTTARPRERALYVHGLGGASTNWTDLAALLAVRFEGWSLDLPGFGRSQPPPRGRYSIRGHVRAVVDVLEHIVAQPGEAAGRPGAPARQLPRRAGQPARRRPPARPGRLADADLAGDAGLPRAAGVQPGDAAAPAARASRRWPSGGWPASRRSRTSGAMIRMCFGEPARVPRERVEQAVQEMRERAEQPWADRALTRSMRGLITSYLRVGRGQRLARGPGAAAADAGALGGPRQAGRPGARAAARRRRPRCAAAASSRGSATSRCSRRRSRPPAPSWAWSRGWRRTTGRAVDAAPVAA